MPRRVSRRLISLPQEVIIHAMSPFAKSLGKIIAPFKKAGKEAYFIFLLAPVLYGIFHYAPGASEIARFLSKHVDWAVTDLKVAIQYGYAFLFLCVAPVLIIRFVFKKKLSAYGLTFKPAKVNGVFILIGLVVIVLADLYAFHFDPSYRRFYPQLPGAVEDHGLFPWSVFFFILYYLGYETFFRGYLLFGMEKLLGAAPAILLSAFLTALVHLHRPLSEFLSSIPAGLVFGAFALYARSYFGILVVHISMGLLLEFLFFADKIKL